MGRSRAAVFASMVAVACGSGASFASTATDPALPRGGQAIAKVRSQPHTADSRSVKERSGRSPTKPRR